MSIENLTKAELKALYTQARGEYDKVLNQNLNLNMARGKPSAAQLDWHWGFSKPFMQEVNLPTPRVTIAATTVCGMVCLK